MTIREGWTPKMDKVPWPFDPPKGCQCLYCRHKRVFEKAKVDWPKECLAGEREHPE